MKLYVILFLLLIPPVVNSNNRGLFNNRKNIQIVDEFEPKTNIFGRGVDRKTGLVIKEIKKYTPRDPAYRIIYNNNGLVKRRTLIKDNTPMTTKILNFFRWDDKEEYKKVINKRDTDSPR